MTEQIPSPDEEWIRRALREAPVPELTDERINAVMARARAEQGRRRGILGVAVLGPVIAAVVVIALMVSGQQSSDEHTPSVLGVPTSTQADRSSSGQPSVSASSSPSTPSDTPSSGVVTPANVKEYVLPSVAEGFGFLSADQHLVCGVRLSSGNIIYGCQSNVPLRQVPPTCTDNVGAFVSWVNDADPTLACSERPVFDAEKVLPVGRSLTAQGVTMTSTARGVEIDTVSGKRYRFGQDGLTPLT